ncbi:UNVERIFIED_CONTAM: hypothetical protein FKN15_018098 [Acipenser sinensis]
MLESEVNCLQFQRIYVQGCPVTRPGPADFSAYLTVVDHSHPYTLAQVGGLPPPAQGFPAHARHCQPKGTEPRLKQVIQTISAVDKDDFANGPRFFFSLADELPNNPNFTLKDNEVFSSIWNAQLLFVSRFIAATPQRLGKRRLEHASSETSFFTLRIHSKAIRPIVQEDNTDLAALLQNRRRPIGHRSRCKSPHGLGDPEFQWASSDLTTKPASFFTQKLESGCQPGTDSWRTKASPAGVRFELTGYLTSRARCRVMRRNRPCWFYLTNP